MVPLVFKTSLGVVRLPEGSTPSLLRQNERRRAIAEGMGQSIKSEQKAVFSKQQISKKD